MKVARRGPIRDRVADRLVAVRRTAGIAGVLAACAFIPQWAWAHGFGQRFTLPLPFWLYGSAACAALLLSFVVLLLFRPAGRQDNPVESVSVDDGSMQSQHINHGNAAQNEYVADIREYQPQMAASRLWLLLNPALMVLAISAGLLGSQHASSNFSMTWFWIFFLLGFFYLAALAGPRHALLNPWWCASKVIDILRGRSEPGVDTPPARWSSLMAWPALAGYMLLIELELFGHASPLRLGWFLLGYTGVWALVCLIAGNNTWTQRFDTFAALFAHISRLWPRRSGSLQANGHPWLAPIDVSAQLLICAMLASTAFDALRESVPWSTQLWTVLLTLFPQGSTNPLAILAALSETYRHAEMLVWLVMPLGYWLLMAAMVGISRRFAPVSHAFGMDMALASLALLPLVLGYHVAHYFPLLLSEGPNLLHLLSDPLGQGWNLLGTAHLWRAPIMLETDTVWHLQVFLIVAGHLGGVAVSHWQACQFHHTQRAVLVSQLPMLVWMMGLTSWGLWILSQPMKMG